MAKAEMAYASQSHRSIKRATRRHAACVCVTPRTKRVCISVDLPFIRAGECAQSTASLGFIGGVGTGAADRHRDT